MAIWSDQMLCRHNLQYPWTPLLAHLPSCCVSVPPASSPRMHCSSNMHCSCCHTFTSTVLHHHRPLAKAASSVCLQHVARHVATHAGRLNHKRDCRVFCKCDRHIFISIAGASCQLLGAAKQCILQLTVLICCAACSSAESTCADALARAASL